jgi:hypothetical protein
MEERFKEVIDLLDVRKDVEALKRDMSKIKGILDAKDLKISWQE